jgi:dihydrofolate reductase
VARLVVRSFTLSLDGFSSAPNQSQENPFGEGGMVIMDWALGTRTFRKMFGNEGGTIGIDDSFAAKADEGVGATIMGRNMFGPIRGPWRSEDWKGWWGPNPPYHHPVFVLTNYPRKSIPMEGGTTFNFVTEGIEVALKNAFEAAKGKDVRIGGGATVVRQYLRAGLIDELHLVMTPKLLGAGERLFDGTDEVAKRYEYVEFKASDLAAHVRLIKRK